ncbi:MAG: hypothetical protein AB7F71_21485 [Burkholderiaceae bacterium]
MQAVAQMARIDAFEAGEIQLGDPGLMHESTQQILHHLRVRKDALIGMVVRRAIDHARDLAMARRQYPLH